MPLLQEVDVDQVAAVANRREEAEPEQEADVAEQLAEEAVERLLEAAPLGLAFDLGELILEALAVAARGRLGDLCLEELGELGVGARGAEGAARHLRQQGRVVDL